MQDKIEKTKGYLKNWIDKVPEEELRLFVRAVTSNNALTDKKLKMELFQRGENALPMAHTCFFSLELSSDYPSQKVFDEKLRLLLHEGLAGTGFQVA